MLAGGQSLVPLLNLRLAQPELVVDINGIAELDYIRADDGPLRIGAMTRQVALERSELVRRRWPLLHKAVRLVGHPQIRSRGTVGGSVAHADPGGRAAGGADRARRALPPALARRRARPGRLGALPRARSTPPASRTSCSWRSRCPQQPEGAGSGFAEHARTHGDFATAGAAAVVAPGGHAGIALLGAGPVPARAEAAERALADGADAARGRRAGRPGRRGRAPPGALRGAGAPRDRGGDGLRISVEINGRAYEGDVEPRTLLSDFIRHGAGLTGTKVGCEQGVCGACTVQLDGEAVRSCLMLAVQANGRALRTVEGLSAEDGDLHPLQRAFHEAHALQCGFCTPGFLMSMEAFIREHPDADDGGAPRGARRATSAAARATSASSKRWSTPPREMRGGDVQGD